MNWKIFFQTYRVIDIKNDNDLLYQVAATVGGKPITEKQFQALINSIKTGLQLSNKDVLLDLCCGNGIITYELAKDVKEIAGIDISVPYINNANRHKKADNITYLLGDITDSGLIIDELHDKSFNRVLLREALAYFSPQDLNKILTYLYTLTAPDFRMMISSVLDNDRKWNFFNTWRRKLTYIVKYRFLGMDSGIGRWWTRDEIETVARKCGYNCCFMDQDPILHTAHYRFDCLLTKRMNQMSDRECY